MSNILRAINATHTACDAQVCSGRFLFAAGNQFRNNRTLGIMQLVARRGDLVDLKIICHVFEMSHCAYITTTLLQQVWLRRFRGHVYCIEARQAEYIKKIATSMAVSLLNVHNEASHYADDDNIAVQQRCNAADALKQAISDSSHKCYQTLHFDLAVQFEEPREWCSNT